MSNDCIEPFWERINSHSFADDLLGLYSPRYHLFGTPCIYFFRDRIEKYANDTMLEPDPDAVFAYAYVHELMHACYDSANNIGYPPVRELEEAFAEYGTLYFLFNAKGSVLYPVHSLAECIVDAKGHLGPKENGYGKELKSFFGIVDAQWFFKSSLIFFLTFPLFRAITSKQYKIYCYGAFI